MIAGAPGETLKVRVATDLQVLDRVCKRSQLGRGVGLRLEEQRPVEASEPQRRVLDPRWTRRMVVESRPQTVAMSLGLLPRGIELGLQRRIVDQLRRPLEQGDRLALQSVRIGE